MCVLLSTFAGASCSALDLCGCIQRAELSSLSADMVSRTENIFAHALFTQGLVALVPPTIH